MELYSSRSRPGFFDNEESNGNNSLALFDPESRREAQRAQAVLDFMTAVETGDVEKTRALLDEQLIDVNLDNGWALKTAIFQNRQDLARMLVVGYNATVDDSILELAVSVGNVEIFEILLHDFFPTSLNVCKRLVWKALVMGRIDLIKSMLALPVCSSVLQTISEEEWIDLFETFWHSGKHSPNIVDVCWFLNEQNIVLPNAALVFCAEWAVDHCSFEMIHFLLDMKMFTSSKNDDLLQDMLRRSMTQNCKQEFIEYLLSLQKQNFQPKRLTLNAAAGYGNIPLLENLIERRERKKQIDSKRLVRWTSLKGQAEILRFLNNKYGVSADAIDDEWIGYIVQNKHWDVLRILYEQNMIAPPEIEKHTHVFVLRKAIQAQRLDIVACATPFTLLKREEGYNRLLKLAVKQPSIEIVEILFRTYLPREEDILLGLRYAGTAEMFRFLMHRVFFDGHGNMETIRLTDAHVQELIEDAIERGRGFVLEYFFSPAELEDFFLDKKNPQLVDRFVSKAPEYRGRMPSHRETDYLYKQRETDKQDKIRFFFVGATLFSFSLRHVWKMQFETRRNHIPYFSGKVIQNPTIKEYLNHPNPDLPPDEDFRDEDRELASRTILYPTTQVLTSRAFGPDSVLVDIAGVGTRHMACLVASPKGARVVLVPLDASSGIPELNKMQTIWVFPVDTQLDIAALVCVGEWLAFTNDPGILGIPRTKKGERVYDRVDFNPFSVVDIAAHHSKKKRAYISPPLAELERQMANNPDLEPPAMYFAKQYKMSKLGTKNGRTFLIPLPRGTTTDSDAFEFAFASPHARSMLVDPFHVPVRIAVLDYQDRSRRTLRITTEKITLPTLSEESDGRDSETDTTLTIMPSSASAFGRIYCRTEQQPKPQNIKIKIHRFTENMEELLEAHVHHIVMQRAAGRTRRLVPSTSLASTSNNNRITASQQERFSRQIESLGQHVLLENYLLPGSDTLFLRRLLSSLMPKEREEILNAWTKKARRVYFGKEYLLDRRPWTLSREQLRLAALSKDPGWQHEEEHDLDEEEDEKTFFEEEDKKKEEDDDEEVEDDDGRN